ncbi:four helix bundle protein [Candidatus Roizmanbacteria bacterium RIFCSPHIGHO2_12_FULL_33_9]|uniref:Four helix bundle protein n=1 Tax=Candidatus Roizmanbacteria bacterium RIFCSPHIGHO2_12_FULL_33_9 TaxID=1802045 RepID=A0A1F7HI46_9BACT|nr:MAG: four helix bundle protein [Candidatus Roizmanbacteria bacterium RIFCSPHIGHO2_12_FULL_33_9]
MTNSKQKTSSTKKYDLEERTLKFAKRIRDFIYKLPKVLGNYEDISQLIKSSGSIGANYIEANDALSKKDFYHRVKISRKEAKETRYWLNLVRTGESEELLKEKNYLIQEVTELMNIFGAIIQKSSV